MATPLLNDDAWIYTRRSRESIDQASTEDQKEHGLTAVDENGWNLAGVLSEEISASRYGKKAREAWAELLRLVGAGKVGVLVLWDSNRGDRTLTTWSAFLDLCREKGTCIYVVSHERLYNLRNPRDWETLAEDGVKNAAFSDKLSQMVKRGKRGAMTKGRPQSPTPYGYEVRYNPETGRTAGWAIVPEEAEIVREIIRRVRAAEPIQRIVDDLTARGVPGPAAGTAWKDGTPKSGLWLRGTVRGIAANHAYAGLVRLGDGRYVERQPQKDGAEWPPIVTRPEWEDAVAVLSSRATGARPGAAVHLLSGIARHECGGWLRGTVRNGYECRNSDMHVKRDLLDLFVRDVICERLSRDDARDLFLRDDTPRIAVLESEIKEYEERLSVARKRFAHGKLGENALQVIEDEIAPEIERREWEISASRKTPALAEAIESGDVRAWWNRQEVQARREVIAAVTGVMVRKVPGGGRTAPRSVREDWPARVVFDWKPQPPKRRGPDAGKW